MNPTTTTAPGAPLPPPPPPLPRPQARAVPTPVERLRRAVAGTPGTLRVAGVTAAALAVVFGLLASYAVAQRSSGISQARGEGAQIVRLQEVRTNLVSADAAATNAFLVGGLEPSAARAAYEAGLETASSTLALAASEADGGDADALAEVNRDIAAYSGLIESARANNRQGFPVGVAYLKQASTLLREEVLPGLQSVTEASARRVDRGYDRSADSAGLLGFAALLGLGGAVGAQAVLALRTRRLLSISMVSAAGVTLVATLLAAGGMAFAQWKANDVRSDAYSGTVAYSQARIDAFDAKSAESLTLISRGSGQAFEERFQEKIEAAQAVLETESGSADEALAAYRTVHDRVRAFDDGGDWDSAVALATGAAPDGSNESFLEFDSASGAALATNADDLSDGLRDARAPLGLLRILLLLAGVVAAGLAWQAAAIRLREYR